MIALEVYVICLVACWLYFVVSWRLGSRWVAREIERRKAAKDAFEADARRAAAARHRIVDVGPVR